MLSSCQTLRKVVAAVLDWLKVASASQGRYAPVLSVGRDGCMLPIVARDRSQEGSTATVSVYDRNQKRLGTVYLGQMPEAERGLCSELHKVESRN